MEVAGGFEGRWDAGRGKRPPHVRVVDSQGEVVTDVEIKAPVPVVHKRAWWNFLLANPAGYLPEHAPIDRIEIDFPRRELHSLGPAWTRRWEPIFITVLLACALPLKFLRRIQ